MEAAAVQKIVDLSRAASEIWDQHGMLKEAAVIPSDARLESLEQFAERPTRHRAHFRTDTLQHFLDYVSVALREVNEIERPSLYMKPPVAMAIFDHGAPGNPAWKQNVASVELAHSAEYAALINHVGKALSQRDLVDYLEDWGSDVHLFVDDKPITLAQAIATVRRVVISGKNEADHQEGDFSVQRSTMGQIEASSREGRLPTLFTLHAPVYTGMKDQEIRVRLSLRTSGDKPAFVLRIVSHDALMRDVSDEVEETITDHIGEKARVFRGTLTTPK